MNHKIQHQKHISYLGWLGALLGLAGSFLIALNNQYSGLAFFVYLFSSFAWILHSIKTGNTSQLLMQIGFVASSLLGIYRWLL